jgi:hypothetical protein
MPTDKLIRSDNFGLRLDLDANIGMMISSLDRDYLARSRPMKTLTFGSSLAEPL